MDPEVQRVGISIEVAAWTRRTLTPCGARLGRNPNEHARKSASNTGSITS